jgi:hypothetical protein
VFPARYKLNSYIVFRKRLVSKRLSGVKTVHALDRPATVVGQLDLISLLNIRRH